MKVFAKFDEIPSMILEVIKETKRYRHTFGRTVVRSVGRSDNVKTVYPPTNTVCGGYKERENSIPYHKHSLRGGIKSIRYIVTKKKALMHVPIT